MLTSLQHHLDNPDDIPPISLSASQFIQARLNVSYLIRIGTLDDLRRRSGFSEQAVLGFIEGINAACEVIELMEEAQRQLHEDAQL